MNLFALTSLIMGVVSLVLALFILYHSKTILHRFWAYFNLSLGIYGIALFLAGTNKTYSEAFFYWRIALFGVANISMFFYLFINELTKSSNKFIYKLIVAHGITFGFLALTTNWVVNSLKFVFDEFYFINAGLTWNILFSIWVIIVIYSFVELHKFIKTQEGLRKIQANYLFYSMLLGFISGASTGVVAWAPIIYPAWNALICVYAAISTYAIFRYQLLDIKIALTRLAVFIPVYAIVLGVPFVLGYKYNLWRLSLWSMLLFATAGPFIYIYFQRKAEEAFLQEEQRTQDLLMQASYGMNTIHNLQKLLDLIVTIVVKTLKVDEGKIFLLNRETDKYELRTLGEKNGLIFNHDDPLMEQLTQKQRPIIYDEMKMTSEMNGEAKVKVMENKMCELSAHVIVPIKLNNSLLGFLVIGERQSKDIYSKELINTLSVLGHQAAIAIDRCNYIEAETRRLEAEGLKERMVSLDHMASSMAHEIYNPMHIIRQSLSFTQFMLANDQRLKALPSEVRKDIEESVARSLSAGERVSGMIKAILDYAKMGSGELSSVQIKDALDGFTQLISPQIKKERVKFDVEIEDDLPPILGDKIQAEEIFMNFVSNSMHAVKRREEKIVKLKIFRKDTKTIRIECADNGYGIEKGFLNDMFLSSTTTKGSSEGTGLGLFRVRKIVDSFGGRVWAESEGKDKGATLIAELPVYEGDKISDIAVKKPKQGGEDG